MNKIILAIAVIAAFAAGYFARRPKTETLYVDVPRTVTDTLYVPVDRIVYRHLPAQIDTLVQTVADTIIIDTVARVQTALERDGEYYGRLEVSYYPRPSWFDIDFDPAPVPVITTTKYINTPRRWYSHPALAFAGGVLSGVAVTQLTK